MEKQLNIIRLQWKLMNTSPTSSTPTHSQMRVAIDDFYWLAVPLNEIVKIAQQPAPECSEVSILQKRSCAEESVRKILCPCALDFDSVVETAIRLFCDEKRGPC